MRYSTFPSWNHQIVKIGEHFHSNNSKIGFYNTFFASLIFFSHCHWRNTDGTIFQLLITKENQHSHGLFSLSWATIWRDDVTKRICNFGRAIPVTATRRANFRSSVGQQREQRTRERERERESNDQRERVKQEGLDEVIITIIFS